MKIQYLLASLTAALCLLRTSSTGAPAQPNILFIMSDDHTTQAIGAYGSRLARLNPTPTLDRLAREGMLFTHAYCNNSICTPSRASILTGQYSQANGVLVLDQPLPPSKQYLPLRKFDVVVAGGGTAGVLAALAAARLATATRTSNDTSNQHAIMKQSKLKLNVATILSSLVLGCAAMIAEGTELEKALAREKVN